MTGWSDLAGKPIFTCECGRLFGDMKAFASHYYERCPSE